MKKKLFSYKKYFAKQFLVGNYVGQKVSSNTTIWMSFKCEGLILTHFKVYLFAPFL